MSRISQLKKITLTYFMCCLKIIIFVVTASNLIKRIPLERKLKNAINKINTLAKVSYFLKNDIVKLQNTKKTWFFVDVNENVTEPWRKRFFSQTCVHLLHYQLNLANIRICIHCYAISTSFLLVYCLLSPPFRESDKHSISGVLFVMRGSARVTCVCSSNTV